MGISSAQLTFTPSFFRGVGRKTTNQIEMMLNHGIYWGAICEAPGLCHISNGEMDTPKIQWIIIVFLFFLNCNVPYPILDSYPQKTSFVWKKWGFLIGMMIIIFPNAVAIWGVNPIFSDPEIISTWLLSGNLTWLLNIARLKSDLPIEMVIFHSYVNIYQRVYITTGWWFGSCFSIYWEQ